MTRDKTEKPKADKRKDARADARAARLKEALRANLHRRKGQARARGAAEDGADT